MGKFYVEVSNLNDLTKVLGSVIGLNYKVIENQLEIDYDERKLELGECVESILLEISKVCGGLATIYFTSIFQFDKLKEIKNKYNFSDIAINMW